MGKVERKIRQSIRRESRKEIMRIRREVVSGDKPWWLPRYLWVKIVHIVLDSQYGNHRTDNR